MKRKFKLRLLAFTTIFLTLMSVYTPISLSSYFGVYESVSNFTYDLTTKAIPIELSPEVGAEVYEVFTEWIEIVPLYWQDKDLLNYYAEFIGNMMDDPLLDGAPLGAYVSYCDPLNETYVGSLETDKGTLIMKKFTVGFQTLVYTMQDFGEIFDYPDIKLKNAPLVYLYSDSWDGVFHGGLRANISMDIPYYDINDSYFHDVAGRQKEGNLIFQMFVDTSPAGSYFHDINITKYDVQPQIDQPYDSTKDIEGTLEYQDETYCFIERIVPKEFSWGFTEEDSKTIIQVLGKTPTFEDEGNYDISQYEINGIRPFEVTMKEVYAGEVPYSQQSNYQTASKSGGTREGWYNAPPRLTEEVEPYFLSATPFNARVPKYKIKYDDNNHNITSMGKTYDPNLIDQYGNIDLLMWGGKYALRPQTVKYDLIHSWHEERGYRRSEPGWFTTHKYWVYKTEIDNLFEGCGGWTVENVYIMQNWTADIVIGAYYDWKPSTNYVGPIGAIDEEEGDRVFSDFPSGPVHAKAEVEFGAGLFGMMLQLLFLRGLFYDPVGEAFNSIFGGFGRAFDSVFGGIGGAIGGALDGIGRALGDMFGIGAGSGIFGTQRGSWVDILLSVMIGIIILIVAVVIVYYLNKYLTTMEMKRKRWTKYVRIGMFIGLIIIIIVVCYFYFYLPFAPSKETTGIDLNQMLLQQALGSEYAQYQQLLGT